ncbi:uncharacterized protein LOC120656831 [Panicum virgatum]|uniref:uncharacterized protein LOC120656831 n=1 Tax=Panicum virgatum TaxID=38727 RepID=UPI0019D5DB8A|nr:uncharacterized protein LOC120656831 [Panicum virgatum]
MAVAAGARRGRGEVSLAALTTEGAAARRVGCAQAATASSSGLQVEEEDERKKKDSGRAHEVELLKTLSCSCSPLYRHTDQRCLLASPGESDAKKRKNISFILSEMQR